LLADRRVIASNVEKIAGGFQPIDLPHQEHVARGEPVE
jgi:hypothetical protein